MTRKRYSLLLPAAMTFLMVSGFALGIADPKLTSLFFLLYALVGGVIVVVVDRAARQKVDEPLTDERIQGIAEKSAWLSLRVSMAPLGVGGFLLIYAFPSVAGLRLIGIGAVCSLALLFLIFGVAYGLVRSRTE